MWRAVAVCVLIGTVAPVQKAQDARAATLTPQEISDGWLLLFDGETNFGWRPVRGEMRVEKGELVLGGQKETIIVLEMGYFELEWEWRWKGDAPPRRKVESQAVNSSPASSEAAFDAAEYKGRPVWFHERLIIESDPQAIASQDRKFKVDSQEQPRLETHLRFAPSRQIRLTLTVPAGTWLALRTAKLKPLGLQPLFNGKNLDGWKEHAGRKSKFSVTPQGELNVKDGPGDLQTEKQWDDFVLRLDCISNGKHLNSGLFFRCLPGQYQQGYEAQIRNQWEGEDRTKPVDFGTGAIYRRQPARKVVATDGEWFTMTILARGNRLMVWVNGYLVTDFLDTRPAHENARQGTKLGKGAISIQGHDPTTDLSFRKLQITPLVRGE